MQQVAEKTAAFAFFLNCLVFDRSELVGDQQRCAVVRVTGRLETPRST
ncbi:hypothetical protein [Aliiruegeria sabulilitoris]|nr:hypothetical protein [Aliiruegeria sabulilitoris]